MRYSASEKLEIIRLVEQSHLPVRRTLGQIGIPRSTFYRWYDQYETGGPEALDDRSPRPDRVWNRIPDDVRSRVVTLALDEPELSPRELAVRFTDAERYFVSEASVYRLLKAHDLITSPAFITTKAADEFKNKTTAPNQLWQTDFTYLKVTSDRLLRRLQIRLSPRYPPCLCPASLALLKRRPGASSWMAADSHLWDGRQVSLNCVFLALDDRFHESCQLS